MFENYSLKTEQHQYFDALYAKKNKILDKYES